MNVVWKQLRDVALMELRLEFRENYFFTYRSFRSLAKASARHVGANPIKDRGLSGTLPRSTALLFLLKYDAK